ncbi:uncharacterized protein LOC124133758 [Haliotis rufescens]|uniref:uncharacterized protein LOC124112433 n=1 Tax=Haliotis rufescens TaxID=6454 RepID=UPI00201EE0FF|nr:uncharacterized protein LOC124112433 [Haliotis rufescens]XP_048250101.1 uncharacterized protein LOC124133758 [Haliotis rufescens]
MPRYCSVPGCKNKIGGHKYPSDPDLQQKWRVAVRRVDVPTKNLWKPGTGDVVCRAHFTDDDFVDTLLGERSRLRAAAVPSIFPHTSCTSTSALPTRPKRAHQLREEEANIAILNVSSEVEIGIGEDCAITSPSSLNEPLETCQSDSQSTQCSLLGSCSIETYINNPKAVLYFAGFQDYDHFMFFFHSLGPAVFELNYQCELLHPKDQLFLTLMKLRQAKDDIELSFLFGISSSTVSQIVITWINFLYFQLKELQIWPSRATVDDHMPTDFGKKFKNTRVILDATEIPIKKPSHVDAQSMTWSSYKHQNTLKTMIGCTPRGAVSFISESFGGSASDRQIIEQSPLLNPSHGMFEKQDSIMADRGIMVQDLFAAQDVQVNTPTMLKGKSQLEPEDVVKDRRIASKRIHVERIIGLSKTFKILKKHLPPSKVVLGSRIVYVCFAISNFRNSIVNEFA